MKIDDKNKFAKCLTDHFPQSTPGDAKIIWEKISGYAFEHCCWAIEQHRVERGADIFRPDPNRLRELAATVTEKAKGPEVRINGISPDKMQIERKYAEALAAYWTQINDAIAAATDEELEEMKRQCISTEPELALISTIHKKPRTCRPLLGAMARLGIHPPAEPQIHGGAS